MHIWHFEEETEDTQQWLLPGGVLKYATKKEWLIRYIDWTLALIQGIVAAKEVDKHQSGNLLRRGCTKLQLRFVKVMLHED
jgi:hypothetical protein